MESLGDDHLSDRARGERAHAPPASSSRKVRRQRRQEAVEFVSPAVKKEEEEEGLEEGRGREEDAVGQRRHVAAEQARYAASLRRLGSLAPGPDQRGSPASALASAAIALAAASIASAAASALSLIHI